MSSKFYTNQEKTLTDIINGILPKSEAVDILVGYFYFSGYKALSDKLSDKQVRILVGLDVDATIAQSVREVENLGKVSSQARAQIREEYYNKFVQLFNGTNLFDDAFHIEQFRFFLDKVENGTLQIRKTLDPCHAKMYIFAYNDLSNEDGEEPGTVITGSSNLSYQGLEGRMEINARFTEKGAFEDAQKIFNKLWDESVNIVDITNVEEWNKKVVDKVWFDKIFSPYLMYIRVLKEYFDIPQKENLLTPYDITEGRYANLRYQTDAVQMALNSLENHNGAIIADVVGLGKSIIAATVARNLHLRTIVVCPPHLCPQWETYRDEFLFTASVFSAGKIEQALNHYIEIARPDEQYLIIIDEAHRFRNEYTQDYADLHQLCSGNKVLLLTATPFNNEPADIYSLLKFFQIPSRSTLKTVENLGASFRELISTYRELREKQHDGTISEEEVNEEVVRISKNIRTIIAPLVVRRSRLDLQEIEEYKEDLKRQKIQLVIPNDPEEESYDLSELEPLYLSTLNRISPKDKPSTDDTTYHFKAARYSPALYIREDMKDELTKTLEDKTGVKFNLLIGRQANVSKFMRHLLVSRFESSVAAFQASLGYMIQSSEHLLQWVNKRHKIPVYKKGNLPMVEDFYESTDDGTYEIDGAFEKYENNGFFEIDMKYVKDEFVSDVQADIRLLKDLRKQWFGKENTIKQDPKLDSFIQIVGSMLQRDPQRKIIVFSAYADTANYLGEKLVSAGLPVMKYTSADASTTNKNLIRANFDAGLRKELQRDDFKVLIATDAISEGYNLHRAGAIFNYDIPYNPTRVIQRIGRINRVNKKVFDQLYIYNYFPTEVGEAETRTKEISTLKMAMIHAIMGEDTKALTKDEEVQAYFKERFHEELAKSEVTSWDTQYRKLLNELKGTDIYQQAMELPYRARTARKVNKPHKGIVAFGKKGNDFVFKIASSTGPPKMLSAEEAIALFSADKEEQPVQLSENFDSVYQCVKSSLFNDEVCTRNEKDLLNACAKVKLLINQKVLSSDYLKDLMTCIKDDALSGYEIRAINALTPKTATTLSEQIAPDYLARQILAKNKATEGEETLILSEEIM